MKKIYSVSIVISIIVVFSFVFLITGKFLPKEDVSVSLNHYDTPEEAVEETLQVREYKLLESNGTYLCLCNTDVNEYNCQYILNDGKGWQVATEYMFRNLVFDKVGKDYMYGIYIREYMGKYMIYISQPYYSIDDNGLLTVTDSLNTKFEETEYANIYKHHYWYWCFDEIPKGYKISIDGEVVYSKK